ncbi:MAG: V-type H+-transporting ATPase subunit D [Spirochaetes bacterium]|nr:MAG: V-type H+-transporting ATPase subunit D [Spirochaetota bacterium]
MAKIKLTKHELKKKKDALKMYRRYLPTLQLKKQQLQMEIRGVEARLSQLLVIKTDLESKLSSWIALFSDSGSLRDEQRHPLLEIVAISTSEGNIAGVNIPVFVKAEFRIQPYDFFSSPLWIDKALEIMKLILSVSAEFSVVERQKELLSIELRTTTQRVNLFEKVKIPETIGEIKKIGIYLGDQQTAQVVRGKISKKKVEEPSA